MVGVGGSDGDCRDDGPAQTGGHMAISVMVPSLVSFIDNDMHTSNRHYSAELKIVTHGRCTSGDRTFCGTEMDRQHRAVDMMYVVLSAVSMHYSLSGIREPWL